MNMCLIMIYNGEPFEPLGIEAIASFAKKYGYEIDLKLLHSSKMDDEEMIKFFSQKYDFIGFSVSYANIRNTYYICEKIKSQNKNIKLFVGSQYATLNAKEILKDCEYLDFVVCGEGEEVVKKILDGIDYESLSNMGVFTRDSDVVSVTQIKESQFIPIEHSLLDSEELKNNLMGRIYSSRGCCANCSFCTHNCYNLNSKTWRGRNIDDVFDEMIYINKKYGISIFMFNDSSIEDPGTMGKKRLEELCDKLIEYPQKFYIFCYVRAETFKDEDETLLRKMIDAGFCSLFVGIEAANSKDLLLYNKRASVLDNYTSMRLFGKNGFRVMPGFIMFNPLSDKKTLLANFEFCEKNLFYFSCFYESRLAIFKGSNIENTIKNEKLLDNTFSYLDPYAYKFKNVDVSEMYKAILRQQKECTFYEMEKDFAFFEPLYAASLHLYNRKYETEEENIFSSMKEELSKAFIKHYKLLFVYNTNEFLCDIPNFDDEICRIYEKYKKLKQTAILSKPFRELVRMRK